MVEQTREQKEQSASFDGWPGVLFNFLLVLIGAGQIFVVWRQNVIMHRQTTIMDGQLKATENAANASRTSAEAAHLNAQASATQLRLLYAPILRVDESDSTTKGNSDGTWHVLLYYKVINVGTSVVRLVNVRSESRLDGEKDYTPSPLVVANMNLTPTVPFDMELHTSQIVNGNVDLFRDNKLTLDARLTVEMVHPVSGPIAHTFERRLICGPGRRYPELISQRDYEGWPSDQQNS